MSIWNEQCGHCGTPFDLDNLKNASRRKIDENIKLFFTNLYNVNDLSLSSSVPVESFLCKSCNRLVEQLVATVDKANKLRDTLLGKTGGPLSIHLKSNQDENGNIMPESPVPALNAQQSKRKRQIIHTPGASPAAKTPFIKASTKKSVRRELLMSPTCSMPKLTKKTSSHGKSPQVNVTIHYKSKTRNSVLTGHVKSSCKYLVMRQFSSAIGHLLEIPKAKEVMINLIMNVIRQECKKLCLPAAQSLLRTDQGSVEKFDWSNVYDQMQLICPSTVNLIEAILGKPDIPRTICALAILLFTRNKKMGLLQTLNSIFMYRGHVRSKVYIPFNRAGFCMSYASTLRNVDKVCSEFDKEVINWKKDIEVQLAAVKTIQTIEEHSYCMPQVNMEADHNYAAPETEEVPLLEPKFTGYQIIMDNLNLQQKVRHKTLDSKNKTHNLVHSMAVYDRVSPAEILDHVHPQGDVLTIPDDAFLPSKEDMTHLKDQLRILIQRVLVDHQPEFKDFEDIVVKHIPHEFTRQSSTKSNMVPLGILEKDECLTEEMIDVIEHLQQYVPKSENRMMPLLLGGDQLSVERGEGAQRARADAPTQDRRLEGVLWKSEDWHAHMISLQDYYNLYYNTKSAADKGTLYQIRNRFDRRGVTKDVKNSTNDCREFLRFTTKGYILLAVLQLEKCGFIKADTSALTNEEKQIYFDFIANKIIDDYVPLTTNFGQHLHVDEVNRDVGSRIKCGYPGCSKNFAIDGMCRKNHRATCLYKNYDGLLNEDDSVNELNRVNTLISENSLSSDDSKFNYSCNLLRDGLLDWNREDAAKENDGNRLIMLWKFAAIDFFTYNHTKYSILAFKLQAQLLALLSPYHAFQLRNNRCVNIHGGAASNVPGDLALEFLNMMAKDSMSALRGNITSKSVERVGRSLKFCDEVTSHYNKGLNVFFGKLEHKKPNLNPDLAILVKELENEDLFLEKPGRSHSSFPNFPRNRMSKFNKQSFSKWLTGKREESARLQRSKSYM